MALVTAAHDEISDTVRRVDLHDVPQQRPPADLDHRFRNEITLFADAGAKAARQNHGFHLIGPPRRGPPIVGSLLDICCWRVAAVSILAEVGVATNRVMDLWCSGSGFQPL